MVPHKYRDFVHLEILNLPEAATSAQLAGYVKLLDLATSSVVLQLSLLRAQPTGLHRAGLSGLSFNFAELERLKNLKKPLTALARYAAAEGLASYAIGANTIGQAQAARDAGFTYIGGSAIHATVSEPRTAVRFAPLPQRRNRWSSYSMG
jgi:hypothetical protein